MSIDSSNFPKYKRPYSSTWISLRRGGNVKPPANGISTQPGGRNAPSGRGFFPLTARIIRFFGELFLWVDEFHDLRTSYPGPPAGSGAGRRWRAHTDAAAGIG